MWKSLLIILSLFVFTFNSAGQESEVTKLKKRVADLEKRVARLENLYLRNNHRINFKDSLFKINGKKLKDPSHSLERWRKLQIGMKDTKVKKILGEPTRITAGKYTAIWWYEWRGKRQYKIGHVAFDNRKKLILWVEP